ncbi:MAG: phenylalanine--tRNA ligase subunit beta, partial [Mycoplasmataceae bacterium]|nr:phenylalanine--tRNA ligase subunit beta [Mycoplasmataceae bacterium]
MFFSENKLRQLANLNQNISTDQIIDAINCIGFEVESINKFNKNEKIKFGQVLSVEKNPNSDKLTICNIKFNDKNRTIQTTAKNVKTGDFLIACVPGSKI